MVQLDLNKYLSVMMFHAAASKVAVLNEVRYHDCKHKNEPQCNVAVCTFCKKN